MSPGRMKVLVATVGVAVGLVAAGCGGDDESEAAQVGDCIDAENAVVECDSESAEMTLVSDQSAPDAIACVVIGDKPQVEVEVDGGTYCAEEN